MDIRYISEGFIESQYKILWENYCNKLYLILCQASKNFLHYPLKDSMKKWQPASIFKDTEIQ